MIYFKAGICHKAGIFHKAGEFIARQEFVTRKEITWHEVAVRQEFVTMKIGIHNTACRPSFSAQKQERKVVTGIF